MSCNLIGCMPTRFMQGQLGVAGGAVCWLCRFLHTLTHEQRSGTAVLEDSLKRSKHKGSAVLQHECPGVSDSASRKKLESQFQMKRGPSSGPARAKERGSRHSRETSTRPSIGACNSYDTPSMKTIYRYAVGNSM